MSGNFGVFVMRPKYRVNVGTIWRSCGVLGASFMGAVGPLKTPPKGRGAAGSDPWLRQGSDTVGAWHSVPYVTVPNLTTLRETYPTHEIVAVEQAAQVHAAIGKTVWVSDLTHLIHPKRAIYLMGSEDHGFTAEQISTLLGLGATFAELATAGPCRSSLNVATMATVVMYDRLAKEGR